MSLLLHLFCIINSQISFSYQISHPIMSSTMNDFETDQFLAETNALDDSLVVKPPQLSLLEASMGNSTKSPLPSFSEMRNHINPFHSTINHTSIFKSTQFLLQPSIETNYVTPTAYAASNSKDQLSLVDQPLISNFSSQWLPTNEQLSQDFISQSFLSKVLEKQSPNCCFPNQNLLANMREEPLEHYLTNQEVSMNNSDQQLSPYSPNQNLLMSTETQSFQFPGMCPSLSNFNFESQFPKVEHEPPTGSSSIFSSTLSHFLNHDKEGVKSFLAGLVRPGPDVPQIYKCQICSMEFSNSHSYGGHRSSHSKKKKEDLGLMVGGRSKKAKLASMKTTSFASKSEIGKCKKGLRGERKQHGENNVVKKIMMVDDSDNQKEMRFGSDLTAQDSCRR